MMTMTKGMTGLLCLAASLAAVRAATIVEIANETPELSTLVAALTAAELVDTLNGEGPFTVFAPTNDAFDALPNGTLEALFADVPALTDVLLYHVAAGAAVSTDLSDGMMIETMQGSNVTVTIGDAVMINDATVITPDVNASNGVVHVIDTVLLPPTDGTSVPTMLPTPVPTPTPLDNIVEIAVAMPELSTLVAALEAAELVETLSGDGPFTVFAPTNDAFDALPNGTLEALLDDIPTLTDILLYHVAPGTALSTDLTDGMMVETLQGTYVTVTIGDDAVMINNATVVVPDVVASNGVVHVIDEVLLPTMEPPEDESDESSPSKDTKKDPGLIAGMAILLAVFVCCLLGALVYYYKSEHEAAHDDEAKPGYDESKA